uniref:DNA2/NAM7 helicase helicase domain-containing protein n=1 Tax=Romanomermis culicivorax TaxID=13658 RepID=A0A915JMH9_ROMCU
MTHLGFYRGSHLSNTKNGYSALGDGLEGQSVGPTDGGEQVRESGQIRHRGSPRTGKTSTATTIVRRAFPVDNSKILITAPLNTAVDNFIRALLKSIGNNPGEDRNIRQNINSSILNKPQWRHQFLLKYSPDCGRPITKEEKKK